MPVDVSVRGDKRLVRTLRRIRARSVPFAQKKATDRAGRLLIQAIQREWNRVFDARRKTFPRSVLRVQRARVTGERVGKPTRVVNIAADALLSDQLRGGTRTPTKGRFLFVPADKRRRRSRTAVTFVTDDQKLVFQYRKTGNDRYIGVLKRKVKIPRRFTLRKPLQRIQRLLPRLLDQELRKEIRAQEARR